ncbi:MAG TPA: YCF48-related protein [Pyrinomonadaceae bacterium]|nr:YCF48-related protein [Pyrinomonadaceae bacterium]
MLTFISILRRAARLRVITSLSLILLFSVAASASWVKQESRTMAWLHGAYFLDAKRGWVVGSNGTLLETADGGETWKAALRRPTEDTIRDIYFSDEKSGWIVCERDLYKLRTNDEARTYLMKTVDAGRTWQKVNLAASDARLVRAVFTEGGRAWAFGEAGALYETRDGGASWNKRPSPTRYLLLGGMFLDGERGWLVGARSTILQTFDGGETWRAGMVEARDVRVTGVSFVEPRIGWAVGSGGRIFMTLDGGRTWRAQNSTVKADLTDVKFLDASEGWAVGADGVLLYTKNSGLKWSLEPSGTTHPLERIVFAGRDRAWAVGFGGTILSYTRTGQETKAPALRRQK